MTALEQLGLHVTDSCTRIGLPRSTYYRRSRGYRHYRPVATPIPQKQRRQPAALSPDEQAAVVDVLTSAEYGDKSVVQTYWRAFDAGQVACSERTFYRIAAAEGLAGDRRRTKRGASGATARPAPAVAANNVGELWSWDITELNGPGRLDRYYLYLVIDVFSRYPVGWCIEYAQAKERAVTMFSTAIQIHGVPTVVHADNGATMRSDLLVDALATAGVLTSYSRPRVSDDNPFSESLFKTIKYDLDCPDRFQSIGHAREWTQDFLHRYATEHRHSGLGHHTPASVHDGTAAQIRQRRQNALDEYWKQHPERFRRRPQAPQHPHTAGINTHLLSQTG